MATSEWLSDTRLAKMENPLHKTHSRSLFFIKYFQCIGTFLWVNDLSEPSSTQISLLSLSCYYQRFTTINYDLIGKAIY